MKNNLEIIKEKLKILKENLNNCANDGVHVYKTGIVISATINSDKPHLFSSIDLMKSKYEDDVILCDIDGKFYHCKYKDVKKEIEDIVDYAKKKNVYYEYNF